MPLISCSRLLIVAAVLCACLVPLTGVFAQAVVAPTCPPGYTLSGNNCVQGAPTPSCPNGYTLSGGRCVQNRAAQPIEGSTAFDAYNCQGLWRHRNGIFASKGYCFKTARAKKAFPQNCFPPYGKLSASEQREINETIKWEKRKGCR